MNPNSNRSNYRQLKIRIGLVLVVAGLLIFILGVDPGLFRLDRSPVVGFIQIAVFLIGLSVICLGGYVTLNSLWNGKQKSIAADIGFRLISTGYVLAVTAGMADIFGLGNQPLPQVPYFGPWQAAGVIIGEVIIAFGFLLMIPFQKSG